MDNRFRKKFRLHWGARAEYFSQYLKANITNDSILELESSLLDILPSLNFIYSHSRKQNYRLSASQTLNRPEYRELAPFAFYDFNTNFVLSGNPEIKRSKITNLDLKYEWFPGNGQFLSGTFFYKYFENPIEQIVRADVTNEISYKNVPYATNYGFEIDFKGIVGLMFHADSTSFANRFSISSNLAIIRSNVDVSKNVGTQYASRPLQGQSPYVFNGSLSYLDEAHDMTMTLTLNNVGSRIYILGSINQPDIWEKSRTFIDFQIQKSFFKNKLDLKINFQNLLAQNQLFYQNKYNVATDPAQGFDLVTNSLLLGDKNNINGYNKDVDDLVWSTTFGRTFSFSLTYKF
jgi:outer membrane receptor protein involved in Fe transport